MNITRRTKNLVLGAMLIAMPLATSACVIPLGNGCDLLIGEPGTDLGVSCNL